MISNLLSMLKKSKPNPNTAALEAALQENKVLLQQTLAALA